MNGTMGGRAPRRSSAQTREEMLQTAIAEIERSGLAVDFANLNLERLIRAAGVPRSSVFRIWPDRASFVVDVINRLFEPRDGEFGPGFDAKTVAVMWEVVDAHAESSSTQTERDAMLREVISAGVERNAEMLARSTAWRIYRVIFAAVINEPESEDILRLRSALREYELRFWTAMADNLAHLATAHRRRFRRGLSAGDVAALTSTLVQGLVERAMLLPEDTNKPRVVVDDDAVTEWSLAALAIYGIVMEFTEPLPAEE